MKEVFSSVDVTGKRRSARSKGVRDPLRHIQSIISAIENNHFNMVWDHFETDRLKRLPTRQTESS